MLEKWFFFLRMRCHFAVAVFSKDHPNALKIACTFMMWHFPFTNQYRNQYWRINFIEKENIFYSNTIKHKDASGTQICAWNFNEGRPGLPKRIGAKRKEATSLSAEANISSTYLRYLVTHLLVSSSRNILFPFYFLIWIIVSKKICFLLTQLH